VGLLDQQLKKLGADADFTYIPGRNHFDLYDDGLSTHIAKEMYSVARTQNPRQP
jgi:hypothetical protein